MGCGFTQYVMSIQEKGKTNCCLAYRPPYYHRNGASELMGLIYGEYAGRSDEFQPGGVSFECGFVPHGVAYEEVSQRR